MIVANPNEKERRTFYRNERRPLETESDQVEADARDRQLEVGPTTHIWTSKELTDERHAQGNPGRLLLRVDFDASQLVPAWFFLRNCHRQLYQDLDLHLERIDGWLIMSNVWSYPFIPPDLL